VIHLGRGVGIDPESTKLVFGVRLDQRKRVLVVGIERLDRLLEATHIENKFGMLI
jgi:hypothetical protein